MATVNTNDLRIKNAKNLVASLSGAPPDYDATAYMFVGNPRPWEGFGVDDNNPPIPRNNNAEFFQVQNEMLALTRINANEVLHVIPRANWFSGSTYDMYRHDYSYLNPSASGATDLYDCRFVVVNQSNDVYVCLYNGTSPENPRGTISTVQPLARPSEPFYTSDGYQWLFLYGIDVNYDTEGDYIPIINSTRENSQLPGAISTAVITNGGSNYTASPEGATNQLPYYFCNIVGDGRGAVARILVEEGSVTEINVVRKGIGYTYGHIDFTRGNVYANLADLDQKTNGLNPLGDNMFTATVIIPPPSGWGNDLVRELGGTSVFIFAEVDFTALNKIQDATFRQIGILHNVEYADPQYDLNGKLISLDDMYGYYGAYVQNLDTFTYTIGEKITQNVTGGDGQIHKAIGYVVGWSVDDNVIRYVQNPKHDADTDGNLYRFTGAEPIRGETSGKVTLPITSFNGYYQDADMTFTDGYAKPELKFNSGTLTYLTNIRPVQRSLTQSEDITLVISY